MSERVTVTTTGFSLHAKDGRMVAYAEHADRALALLRETHEAEIVTRVSDGARIATKHRLDGESVLSWLSSLSEAS